MRRRLNADWSPKCGCKDLVAMEWPPQRPLRPTCRKSRFAGNQSAVSHVSSQAPVGFMVGTKRRAMGRREIWASRGGHDGKVTGVLARDPHDPRQWRDAGVYL